MEGIKETKELVKFGCVVMVKYKSAMADGKIDFTDIPEGLAIMQAAPAALEGISEIPAEMADLDTAEYDELVQVVKPLVEGLIENDQYEAIIFQSLAIAKSILEGFKLLKPVA